MSRRWPPHALAFLGYLALTLFFLRPAAMVLGTHIAPDPYDPVFNLVVLKWGIHEMWAGLHGFWDMPFFFPAHQVTTYSDHLLGPAAFATLFTAVVPNPLAAFNVLLLGSFVLCGFNTWFVLRRSGLGTAASFLGGCLFAFSPFRWDQLPHLQVLLMQWIPVTLWSWDRLLGAPTWRRAVVFFLFYVLHVTGGSYLAYMIHFPMLALLLVRAPGLWPGRRAALRILLPTGLACGLVLAGIYTPYLRNAGQRARTPEEIQEFGASLVSFLTPAHYNLYADLWPHGLKRPENALFPGVFTAVLAGLAAWRGWKRHRTPPLRPLSLTQRIIFWSLIVLTALAWLESELRVWALAGRIKAPALAALSAPGLGAFALAAGLLALALRRAWGGNQPFRLADLDPRPLTRSGLLVSGILCFLLSFPLLYLPLMRVIPGLSGMRVPPRFNAFVSFSLVFFAAGELDRRLLEMTPLRRRLAAGLVAVLLLLEVTPRPLDWEPLPQKADLPAVYDWLAAQPNVDAVFELPRKNVLTDISYMYFATFHWKPLVNGYSGYIPDHYAELMEGCCYPLPDPDQLAKLRTWGVTHVLLHKHSLNKPWKRQAAASWAEQRGVSVDYEDEEDRVYRIAP